MSFMISNNIPVKSFDKKDLKLPSDTTCLPTFDSLAKFLGKYVSSKEECIILHQHNVRKLTIVFSNIIAIMLLSFIVA